jgi:hypothetical protein
MARKLQFTLAQLLVAVVVIGYFCAFWELAVLLGIFLLTLLFLVPIPLGMCLWCRVCFGKNEVRLFPPLNPRTMEPRDGSSLPPST